MHEPRKSSRTSNHMLLDIAASLSENDNPRNLPVATVEPIQKKSVDSIQMPPPPAPLAATNSALDETSCGRPQRAAKLKSEKNLKEPTLKNKLRRPSNTEVQIKLEEDNRLSQMHNSNMNVSKSSTNSARSDASICILPSTATAIVELESEDEQNVGEANSNQNQRSNINLGFVNYFFY